MFEGSRAFDIAWGAATGTLCFALGTFVIVRWLVARHGNGPSLFGSAVDPKRRLHLAYGIAAMGMGGTNYGCRFIDHRYLSGVHEGFAPPHLAGAPVGSGALTFLRGALLAWRLLPRRRAAI